MKRFISFAVVIAMLFAMMPLSAFAEGTDGLVYKLSSDGTYYIVDNYTGSSTSVVIPSTYNGKPVKAIGYAAFYECDVTSVTLGNSVTTIGDSAFGCCLSLESIEIPNSVITIGNNAFGSCDSLMSIEIPSSVTTIGDSAFSYCVSLISMEIPNSVTTIGDYAFDDCYSLEIIEIPPSVTTIGSGTFSSCRSLASVKIPDTVTTIGDRAFVSCVSLMGIEIPSSVTTIGEDAFLCCYSLENIEIPSSVTTIGAGAFYECNLRNGIEIPSSVTTIGAGAFAFCYALGDIYCEAESQPSGWSSKWNSDCDATVHWGCVIDDPSKEPIDPGFDIDVEMGEANADAKFDIVVDAPEYYRAGKELAVTVRIENITAENGVSGLNFVFKYDSEKLTLVNDLDEDNECAVDCITNIPDKWENLISVAFTMDEETGIATPINNGIVTVNIGTAYLKNYAVADGDIELTFKFLVSEDATDEIYTYVTNNGIYGSTNTQTGFNNFTGSGSYATSIKLVLALGDMDGNDLININDYITVRRSVMGTYTLSAEQFEAADVNGDDNINMMDYIAIRRHVMGTFVLGS